MNNVNVSVTWWTSYPFGYFTNLFFDQQSVISPFHWETQWLFFVLWWFSLLFLLLNQAAPDELILINANRAIPLIERVHKSCVCFIVDAYFVRPLLYCRIKPAPIVAVWIIGVWYWSSYGKSGRGKGRCGHKNNYRISILACLFNKI